MAAGRWNHRGGGGTGAWLRRIAIPAGAGIGIVLQRRHARRISAEASTQVADEHEARARAERQLSRLHVGIEGLQTEVRRLKKDIGLLKKEVARHEVNARVKRAVATYIPLDANVAVVSRGDPELISLGPRDAEHFPQTNDGRYAGYNPPTSEDAIRHLEDLRAKGCDFLLFPTTAFWWFDHYAELKKHLDDHYRLVVRDEEACAIYDLTGVSPESARPATELTTSR